MGVLGHTPIVYSSIKGVSAMHNLTPKFPIGTRVKIINETHRNGDVGYVGDIKKTTYPGDVIKITYYIQFSGGVVSSFFEANLKEDPYTKHLKTSSSLENLETVKLRGRVSSSFNEDDEPAVLIKESSDDSLVRAVTRKDIPSKHFIDWFFKHDDWWTGMNPQKFPYEVITTNDDGTVFGFFWRDNLEGIIRADEFSDEYELSFFFVNKALQNRGIGRSLLNSALSFFDDKPHVLRVYTDNENAIRIYKKFDFKVIGTSRGEGYRPDFPHYVMRRDVQSVKF